MHVCYTLFLTKKLKHHTLYSGTYLYSHYLGISPPHPPTPITACKVCCLDGNQNWHVVHLYFQFATLSERCVPMSVDFIRLKSYEVCCEFSLNLNFDNSVIHVINYNNYQNDNFSMELCCCWLSGIALTKVFAVSPRIPWSCWLEVPFCLIFGKHTLLYMYLNTLYENLYQ